MLFYTMFHALQKSLFSLFVTFFTVLLATESLAQTNDLLGDLSVLEQDIKSKDQAIEREFLEAQKEKAKAELLRKNEARMDSEISKIRLQKERALAGYSHKKPSFNCTCYFTLCLTATRRGSKSSPSHAQSVATTRAAQKKACVKYRDLLNSVAKPYDDRISQIRESSGTLSEEELDEELVRLESQSLNADISGREIAELDAAVDGAIASQKHSANEAKRLAQEQENVELEEEQQRLARKQQEIEEAKKIERETKAKFDSLAAEKQRNHDAFCANAAAKGQTPCSCIPPEERDYICK